MVVTTTCAIRSFTEHNRRKEKERGERERERRGEEQNKREFSLFFFSFFLNLTFSFTRCYYQRVDGMIVNSNGQNIKRKIDVRLEERKTFELLILFVN